MNRLLTTMLVGLAGIQGFTLIASSRPKLVVGIMVDQLRTDYLENLKDMLGEGGFRRLMDQGLYLRDVDFVVPGGDAASASAIIQTGSYPRQNGVTGSRILDRGSNTMKSVFNDPAYLGNFTDKTYSPGALRVTTVADELAVENGGKSKIHSIAPDAAQAIVLAGHAGSSAFWLNDESGRWSSSTYYTDAPQILPNRNYSNPLVSRLDTLKWTPLKKFEPYPDITVKEVSDGFKYNFSRSDRDVFSQYKQTPFVNTDITEAAIEYINGLNLGKGGETTDVLNLGYTLAPYTWGDNENYRYSLQDAYLRLDKDLEALFKTLDKTVGKDDVLVYLSSTGYFTDPAVDTKKYRLPGGVFSVKRALSLLNAYLSAKYGNGSYVDNYAEGQIFLSENVIEEKNLDFSKVAEEARDFLVKMSGVSDAYTMADLMSPAIEQLEARRLALDPKTSGHLILEFTPGWKVVDDNRFPNVTEENKSTAYATPVMILGGGIKPEVVDERIEATSIAPTLARTLRIRAPNSSLSRSLPLK